MTVKEYTCYNCQKPCIRGDLSYIRAVGHLFHKECFKCNLCQISVMDKFYIMEKDDAILCEKDYYQQTHSKCHECNEPITKNNYQIIGDLKYHQHCLHCPGCSIEKSIYSDQEQVDTFERYNYNNRPYCRYHYSLIKGTECIGCGQTVLCEYTESNGKWHQECYMIKKYWHICLIDLQPQCEYKSKNQLFLVQNEIQEIRCHLWKELSLFEDITSKTISSIVLFHQASEYTKEYEACSILFRQVNVLFSVLDLVFCYLTHLSCDVSVKKLGDQFIHLLDILCQTNHNRDEDYLMATTTVLSQLIRDLIKLSLQQTIILKRQDTNLIDNVLGLFHHKQFKVTMDAPCLDHCTQLVDMAMTRLSFVLNIQQGKQSDETITLYKPQSIFNRPSLFPLSQQKRMIHSTSNIPYLTKVDTLPKRSKSTSKKHTNLSSPSLSSIQPVESSTMNKSTSASRMDTIRRALTTSRKKETSTLNRSTTTSIFQQNSRREKKSFSLHNPATPPLFISLPDIEQLHTTPPLSPPSANQQIWTIPTFMPDTTQPQDAIVRHMALLYIASDNSDELDDLLALVDNKKSSPSLWGKLKTHILTPTESPATSPLSQTVSMNEKKIGVSLSNTSHPMLNIYKMRDSTAIHQWKEQCPSVASCFSSHSLAPNFLKDCVLAMVDDDINTEGIFRKNGNIRGLKEMCDHLDDSQQVDWTDFFREQSIIQLAAFLKRYLRELPEPLLTFKLHKWFLLADNRSIEEQVKWIHHVVALLPKINRDILLLVLALLHWVAKHEDQNKMGYENLARVMAPNILYHHKKQTGSSAADVSLCHGEIRVVATMIEYYETLIKVPGDCTQLLDHPKMAEFLNHHAVDLSCSKHFVKSFQGLTKLRKQVALSNLPPSPSTSLA